MLRRHAAPKPGRSIQRGLSIVEMMVGVAVGLIVVAAATLMVAAQLADNRRLLLETQVQQDLRATADLITRELRDAGYWGDAQRSTSAAANIDPRLTNPYSDVSPSIDGVTATAVTFSKSASPLDNNVIDDSERRGFRLNGATIESQLGADNWQPLTDPAVLKVTGFRVTTQMQPVTLECNLACSPGGSVCPPVQQIRRITIDVAGEAAFDAKVQRSIRTSVRLRNDAIVGECRD